MVVQFFFFHSFWEPFRVFRPSTSLSCPSGFVHLPVFFFLYLLFVTFSGFPIYSSSSYAVCPIFLCASMSNYAIHLAAPSALLYAHGAACPFLPPGINAHRLFFTSKLSSSVGRITFFFSSSHLLQCVYSANARLCKSSLFSVCVCVQFSTHKMLKNKNKRACDLISTHSHPVTVDYTIQSFLDNAIVLVCDQHHYTQEKKPQQLPISVTRRSEDLLIFFPCHFPSIAGHTQTGEE